MGLNFICSSNSYDKQKSYSYPETSPSLNPPYTQPYPPPNPSPPPNPDPENYEVLKTFQMGTYLIVELRYPDCTNYEGKKIMVYEKMNIKQLLGQNKIDPHFSNHPHYKSPVARFEPTLKGWDMAKVLCAGMLGQKII